MVQVSVDDLDTQLRSRLQTALGSDYRVGKVVGRGASSRVWEADDIQLDRQLAVKVLLPEAGAAAGRRFRREAQLIARVRHQHVMPIYHVREHNGLSYFLMPLVKGETLRDLLRREGRLPFDEVVRILDQAAAGLQAAHEAGIIHRDVKPENILLEGSERSVLLTDFGVARPFDRTDQSVTSQGEVVGTAEYMSPEQVTDAGSVNERTDIYALGIVGFEMLTGRLPFEAASWPAVLLKQVSEAAPSVERFRHNCPQRLADLVARCLSKNPVDRYASMAELREALASLSLASGSYPLPLGIVPLIRRQTARRFMLARFRRLTATVMVVTFGLFLFDLRDGALGFAPFVALILAVLLALQYGSLARAGFSWRDLLSRGISHARIRDTGRDGIDPQCTEEAETESRKS
ncbi:MAG TPA: serine/threonine-protein kinase [Gemmatimonadales bacterium]|nr:serine/threonine-protein kinase [Gemmatimonadales bacterium]